MAYLLQRGILLALLGVCRPATRVIQFVIAILVHIVEVDGVKVIFQSLFLIFDLRNKLLSMGPSLRRTSCFYKILHSSPVSPI